MQVKFTIADPEYNLLVQVSAGNYLQNPHYVLWEDGKLYALHDEQVWSTTYRCIVSWRGGQLTVEDIKFLEEKDAVKVLLPRKTTIENITEEVVVVASALSVLRDSQPEQPGHITEHFYDQRHCVRPLVLNIGQQPDSPTLTLYFPMAQLARGLASVAQYRPVHIKPVAELPGNVSIPLTMTAWLETAKQHPAALTTTAALLKHHGILESNDDISELHVVHKAAEAMQGILEEAFQMAGYRMVDDSRQMRPGEWRFLNSHIELFFLPAQYAHNFFLTWDDGRAAFCLFPGDRQKSGRSGVTLCQAQQFFHQIGVKQVLLIDNGLDLRLLFKGKELVGSPRQELKGMFAIGVRKGTGAYDAVSVS